MLNLPLCRDADTGNGRNMGMEGCTKFLHRLQDPSGQALISLLINALGKDMSLAQD